MLFRRTYKPANESESTPDEHSSDLRHLRNSFRITAYAVAILWAIRLFESVTGADLARFAITPREIPGLMGVLTAPLIHGDFAHLISNSLPVLFLGTGLLYLYPRSAPFVLALVYLLGGFAVWCFARPAAHLGASGVTYGLVTFLFFSGVIRRDPPSIGLALIVAFLYGGTIWGVLPIEQGVSFESHLAGAILGVIGAFLFRNFDQPEQDVTESDDGIDDDFEDGYDDNDDDDDALSRLQRGDDDWT